MPWIVGIDEAGYGPNLGPFVMTSVALRVPDEHTDADLWHLLRDEPDRREQVRQGDERYDDASDNPQPGFLPVDTARIPGDQHRQQH